MEQDGIGNLTQTFRKLVIPGTALVAGASGEIPQARAFPVDVADGRRSADAAAIARPAIRITVEALHALIASGTAVALLTPALSGFLVADALLGALNVAVAIWNRSE